MEDLNKLKIDNADGPAEDLSNNSVVSPTSTQVYFKDLERVLIEKINEADIVVGCVAWLTSKPIVEALSRKVGVSIVVQKEDFLRPDMGSNDNWKRYISELYSTLKKKLNRYDEGLAGTALRMMSYGGDPDIDPVRCVGNHNSTKSPSFPRMHNKFVIFCKLSSKNEPDSYSRHYGPYAVWTGSYNFSKSASRSFENALYIKEPPIVQAYFKEYGQICALSEKLNWEDNWVAPEWRIGS